jgi:hypothetical protein
MTFCKYTFPDGVWEQLKPTIQNQEEYIDCAVVELGKLCKQTDQEGNCIEQSSLYSVDIMWYGDISTDFNQYEIFPEPCGVHVFAGCEQMYLERYCAKFPDYCKQDETTNRL